MTDLHKSLDETVAAIRAEHAAEMQACKDRTLAAEVEATLLREQLAKANEERFASERLAVKLITQFGTVEKVFAEAKALAEAVYAEESIRTELPQGKWIKSEQIDRTDVPVNRFSELQTQLEAKTKEMK